MQTPSRQSTIQEQNSSFEGPPQSQSIVGNTDYKDFNLDFKPSLELKVETQRTDRTQKEID